jgi:hypothetical protein
VVGQHPGLAVAYDAAGIVADVAVEQRLWAAVAIVHRRDVR